MPLTRTALMPFSSEATPFTRRVFWSLREIFQGKMISACGGAESVPPDEPLLEELLPDELLPEELLEPPEELLLEELLELPEELLLEELLEAPPSDPEDPPPPPQAAKTNPDNRMTLSFVRSIYPPRNRI
ncbi:hypothetical protein [Microbulbifer sp. MCCC 1A16149]|uniref:hypothetical protein n=1 Tax=Microbulbifer sp. MCCC 1A16149 TaxID=3411322 RepID=UPI003D14C0F0